MWLWPQPPTGASTGSLGVDPILYHTGRAYRTPFDYANWTLITITALWTVAFFFADILACGTDPSSAWRSAYSLRHECIKTFSMMAACGISSWILDLAILVEPLVVVSTVPTKVCAVGT